MNENNCEVRCLVCGWEGDLKECHIIECSFFCPDCNKDNAYLVEVTDIEDLELTPEAGELFRNPKDKRIIELEAQLQQAQADVQRKIREVNLFAEKWAIANGHISALKVELEQSRQRVKQLEEEIRIRRKRFNEHDQYEAYLEKGIEQSRQREARYAEALKAIMQTSLLPPMVLNDNEGFYRRGVELCIGTAAQVLKDE